jgi:glutaminyl-peptide cyclotransferase
MRNLIDRPFAKWRRARDFPAFLLFGVSLVLLAGCGDKPAPPGAPAASSAPRTPATAAEPPGYTYEVVNVWPHDREAFTEGLVYLGGILLESTGLNGHSTLRKVDLQTGRVLQQVELSSRYFGEGTTVLGDKIYQLTWQNQTGFVYNVDSMALLREFSYTGEGWGLTTDGQSLIMSDGTNQIRFIDPVTFKVTRAISVFSHGEPLKFLNELEYVKGELYANIWQTQSVVRIDPATGRNLGMVDFSGLPLPANFDRITNVLNGIAYDAAGDRLFVTGKNWPNLFEVRLKPR